MITLNSANFRCIRSDYCKRLELHRLNMNNDRINVRSDLKCFANLSFVEWKKWTVLNRIFLIRCSLYVSKCFQSIWPAAMIMMTIQQRSGHIMHIQLKRHSSDKCVIVVWDARHSGTRTTDICMLRLELCVYLWCSWTKT